MARTINSSLGLPLLLLLISSSLQLTLCAPESSNSTSKVFIVSSTSVQANESASMKAEPRVKEFSSITVQSPALIIRKKDDRKPASSSSSSSSSSTPATIVASNASPRIPSRFRNYNFKQSSRDTYLDALNYSHNIKDSRKVDTPLNKIARREYTPGPVYRGDDSSASASSSSSSSSVVSANHIESQPKISRISSGSSASSYLPSVEDSYSLPHYSSNDFNSYSSYNTYSSLSDKYGAPQVSYEASPQTSYGPPSPQISYGPPSSSSHHSYGPPSYVTHGSSQSGLGSIQATYSTSHPLPDIFPLLFPPIDFSWPISLKLNAYTLIKIVLKIIVFKMIVKFIATICLLLFIPKLIQPSKPSGNNHDDDEDDSRGFSATPNSYTLERLQLLSTIITKSLEHFEDMSKKHNDETAEKEKKEEKSSDETQSCTSLACQIKRSLLATSDTWDDYIRLFKSYVAEEEMRASAEQSGGKQRSRRR